MFRSIQGKHPWHRGIVKLKETEPVADHRSAFWGQSFVTELTRISAASAEKFQAKSSLMTASAQVGQCVNGGEIINDQQRTH